MRLTLDIVQTAINELQSNGEQPTYMGIIKHVGFGSCSTLRKLREQYPDVFKDLQAKGRNKRNYTVVNDNLFSSSELESRLSRIESVITEQNGKLERIENELKKTEEGDGISALESKIKALESEKKELKVRLDDKEDGEVARINELEKERYDLQGENNDLKDTIDDLKNENEAIKRTHAKDRENIKGEQDKLVESLKSKNSKLQAQLQAQLVEQENVAQLTKKLDELNQKLESVQCEAQTNIDSLAQKLSEAKQENERLAGEYNQLHKKYTALKVDVDDGEAPAKSTKRKPLTLDSDAQKTSVNDVTIDLDGQQIVIPDGQVPENREQFIASIQQIVEIVGRNKAVKLLSDNEVKTFRGKKFSNDILRKPPFNC